MLHHTVRVGRIVAGVLLIVLGIVLALPFVPGPGVVVIATGLWLLSHEFEWARKLSSWARANIERLARRRHVG